MHHLEYFKHLKGLDSYNKELQNGEKVAQKYSCKNFMALVTFFANFALSIAITFDPTRYPKIQYFKERLSNVNEIWRPNNKKHLDLETHLTIMSQRLKFMTGTAIDFGVLLLPFAAKTSFRRIPLL